MPDAMEIEISIAQEDLATKADLTQLGDFSPFTCPECHGALIELRQKIPPRFRCHTGHAFTGKTLLAALDEKVEDSIWNAVRTLNETIMLMRHLADHLGEGENGDTAEAFRQKAKEAEKQSELIRQVVFKGEKLGQKSTDSIETP